MEQTKYDVFISYSRKDYVDEQKNIIPNNAVLKIKEELNKAGISFWFDEEGVYSGENFVEKIITNIESSTIFIFLSTENSNKSRWTCKEIASADEFGKYIIPVRIDKTPYNKKVLFRISDLDYIEYYNNPQKGVEDLINAIKKYLNQIIEEEKKKEEEERKRQEEEAIRRENEKKKIEQSEKRKQEKQNQIIAEIRRSCIRLNNEEIKLTIDRDTLFVNAERIADAEQQKTLKSFITDSSPIRQDYQKKIERLQNKLSSVENQLNDAMIQNERLDSQNIKYKESIVNLENELQKKELKHNNSEEIPTLYIPKQYRTIRKSFVALILISGFIMGLLTNRLIFWKKTDEQNDIFADETQTHIYMDTLSTQYEKKKNVNKIARISDGEFIVDGVLISMIQVEGGTFLMGNNNGEDNESPVHKVNISNFYIGKTEVTQELWEVVMGNNPSHFKGEKRPVERVSWDDCQGFIQKLNKILYSELSGKKFRLPTEAEWEYAARGGKYSKGKAFSGEEDIKKVAWYEENSNKTTHPVAQKQPNELGLYDMSGNVWEWCEDWYDYYNKKTQVDPKGPLYGTDRILRGGGWGSIETFCRVANRDGFGTGSSNNDMGFRLVLE